MGRVQSIERAFVLLDAFSVSEPGITELATRVGMPKSTVARIVSTLQDLEAVERVSGDATYRIGPKIYGLAAGRRQSRRTAVAGSPAPQDAGSRPGRGRRALGTGWEQDPLHRSGGCREQHPDSRLDRNSASDACGSVGPGRAGPLASGPAGRLHKRGAWRPTPAVPSPIRGWCANA